MWQLATPKTRRAELDFSLSGQVKTSVSQLWDDGIQLINAVEYVNWGEAHLQVMVCEACGIVGCQSQGWVELKRVGSVALIIPAFAKIEEASEIMKNEYLPPNYLVERGAICIEQESYRNLLCQLTVFPDFDLLAPLPAWEAAKIFQLEAPSRVLGNLSNSPTLPQDAVIASSEGDLMEQTTQLVSLINKLLSNSAPVRLRRVTEHEQVISLYLDISGFPEWKALSYNGFQYSLYLEPGYIIE